MQPALGGGAAGGGAGAVLALLGRSFLSAGYPPPQPIAELFYDELYLLYIIQQRPIILIIAVVIFGAGILVGLALGPLVDCIFALRCAWGRAALALYRTAQPRSSQPPVNSHPRPGWLPPSGYRFAPEEE